MTHIGAQSSALNIDLFALGVLLRVFSAATRKQIRANPESLYECCLEGLMQHIVHVNPAPVQWGRKSRPWKQCLAAGLTILINCYLTCCSIESFIAGMFSIDFLLTNIFFLALSTSVWALICSLEQ